MRCLRGNDPCRQIGCSCPIESQPMDKVDAELIAAGIDPKRLAHETSVLVRVIKEKYALQAKLDRVTELVAEFRSERDEDYRNGMRLAAIKLERALKGGKR